MNVALPLALAGVGAIGGLTMALPLGPAGMSCVARTAREGLRAGLLAGIAALAVDTTYAAVAATTFVHFGDGVLRWRDLLRVIAGIVIGVMVLWRSPSHRPTAGPWSSPAMLTLANPAAIAVFAAIVGTTGYEPSEIDGPGWWWLMMGATIGAGVWWLTVPLATWATRVGRSERTLAIMTRATRAAGGVLAVALVVLGGVPLVCELLARLG